MIENPTRQRRSSRTTTKKELIKSRYVNNIAIADVQQGDIFLTHNQAKWYTPKGFFSGAIRWCQRIRFRGTKRKFAYYNHAGFVYGTNGEIVEALAHGITAGSITKYSQSDITIIRPPTVASDLVQMVAFARACMNFEYGFITIFANLLRFLIGLKLAISWNDAMICSEFVCRIQERGNAIFPQNTALMAPADLAEYFNVEIG